MIAIIDYGVGNLFSLESSFTAIGVEARVTADRRVIHEANGILLPGVGAFGDAADKLRDTRLDEVVIKEAADGKPLLGICLGMQLLCETSSEYGLHRGLGLIPGDVKPISGAISGDLKIPHMGWNALHITKQSTLFSYISEGDFVYFVHSFHAEGCGDALLATTEYGGTLTAAVEKENVYGCQFHPEKSGSVGLNILRAFAKIGGEQVC